MSGSPQGLSIRQSITWKWECEHARFNVPLKESARLAVIVVDGEHHTAAALARGAMLGPCEEPLPDSCPCQRP